MGEPAAPSGRAVTEGWLFDRIHALEKLVACYQDGTSPSGELVDELERTRSQVEYLKEHRRDR